MLYPTLFWLIIRISIYKVFLSKQLHIDGRGFYCYLHLLGIISYQDEVKNLNSKSKYGNNKTILTHFSKILTHQKLFLLFFTERHMMIFDNFPTSEVAKHTVDVQILEKTGEQMS